MHRMGSMDAGKSSTDQAILYLPDTVPLELEPEPYT